MILHPIFENSPSVLSSLESRGGVAVSLEGTVDDIGSSVHKIWHNWLILRTIPRNISWLSNSVSVASLVILMEDWRLSSSPLSMRIWNWWVLWKNSGQIPPEEIWIVQESSSMELMVVEYNWSLISKTSSESLRYEDNQPEI